MRCLSLGLGLLLFSCVAQAEMIRNDAIGNDPQKEKLCASRTKGQAVPFEIDSRYLKSARSFNPDATFIAIDGISPQLVQCHLREGTGKYEPASYSPEANYWRLIRPKQFKPGIDTDKGKAMAAKVCVDAAPAKINRPNFDHSVYSNVVEISIGGPRYRPGASIAGTKAERYDIAVEGTSFYKSSGPDLAAVTFTCLLSPMLAIKGIQFK
ncbi:hypothetical protein LMG26788_00068 [Achromobacter pulmonis]|uniref:Secreted protein n=1 Tax=Achromobacter pulmonis TaxID=1389932 RepID=A0A6S7DAX3_9BURK|nr:hypothetical protein [Achromobacter pulmonis]CAB3817027.1 hypothetical protein LMG26788_00068 [Achromobacter pulmonis]